MNTDFLYALHGEVVKFFKKDKSISALTLQAVSLLESAFGTDHVELIRNPEVEMSSYEDLNTYNCSYHIVATHLAIIKVDKVRIHNEKQEFIDIYDLFIEIPIRRNGGANYPRYKRSTFTKAQLSSRYIHSHCPRLDTSHPAAWKNVCTGSGPINDTIARMSINPTIEDWMGFIAELNQIIRIESIEGGPYIQLKNVAGGLKKITKANIGQRTPAQRLPAEFMESYIRAKRLKLGFMNGRYCLGCTFPEWLLDISAYWSAWKAVNNLHDGLYDNLCTELLVKEGELYDETRTTNDYTFLVGTHIITFRGQDYNLALTDAEDGPIRTKVILPAVGAGFLNSLLNTINNWHHNESTELYEQTSPASECNTIVIAR